MTIFVEIFILIQIYLFILSQSQYSNFINKNNKIENLKLEAKKYLFYRVILKY